MMIQRLYIDLSSRIAMHEFITEELKGQPRIKATEKIISL